MPAARPSRHLRLLGLGLLLCASQTRGQQASTPVQPGQRIEVQLSNGDRLTGELIWRAEGKLRFRSPILGDLTLSETDAAILEIPEALDPSVAARGTSAKPASVAPAKPTAGRVASAKPAPAAAAPAKERWKGKVELGYVQQSGRNDTLNYNARVEAERSVHRHSLRATGRLLYAEQNDRTNADRQDASFRWRYQLTKRAFTQSQTVYYSDAITQITTNLEQNAGLGYRIVDQPRHVVNIGAGITGQYREWEAGTNGWAPYGEIFQDYTFKINDRITLNQDLVAQFSPSDRAFNIPSTSTPATVDPDEKNYKVRFNSSLQGKVTERISVNLRFEYELDNAIQVRSARETKRVTSSLGYAF